MQDDRFLELRQRADDINAESIDQLVIDGSKKLKKSLVDHWEEELEYYRSQTEPKYVIVKHGRFYEFRARYVDMHRTLLSSDEIRRGLCDGGGFWGVDGENKRVTLYDSSSDFGRPKHIEEAIKQSGKLLLEILGRVCDKSGEEHDLSDYTITYIDAVRVRHVVEPPYDEHLEPGSDIMENARGETREQLKRLSREDYEQFGRHTNHTPPRSLNKKKRKAKARQQKQSRRKNRR